MIRSPQAIAIAVRRPDGSILVKRETHTSWIRRLAPLAWPVLRGAVVLIESLVIGIRALTFSADVAIEDEKKGAAGKQAAALEPGQENSEKGLLQKLWMGSTVLFSLALGLGLFFYVPLLLTELTGATSGVAFNLVDGVFRLAIFLGYLFLITLIPDIRRIFEYHGAEHKSIFAFESGQPLTPETAKGFPRLHPRCGTSFLLIVMIVSIVVFMALGKPYGVGQRLLRLALVPVIGGLSYELIRLSDRGYRSRFWRPFILPGVWLQKITTREPDASQLEVAVVAIKSALGEDVHSLPNVVVAGETAVKDTGQLRVAATDVS
jgi:uncharacterized protein YqhQ